ncbi:MAG: diaminopimelate epimerase [Anaerovoracaceae bacterium]
MISFAKYHGCGNSFVILAEEEAGRRDFSDLARAMCREATGIGADGLIIVRTSPQLEMIFYNRDGSRAPMCGNGIRCFARFCRDEGICTDDAFDVKTLAGTMRVQVCSSDPFTVEIGMGRPDFDPRRCGIEDSEPFLHRRLRLADGSEREVSTFFMGTVHTVLWVDDFVSLDVEALGRELCRHPAFPEQTNVNMARRIDAHTVELKTYERGAGLTLACGTGACATVVWGHREGLLEDACDVLLPCGRLHITVQNDENVVMRGPAAAVARGTYLEEGQ